MDGGFWGPLTAGLPTSWGNTMHLGTHLRFATRVVLLLAFVAGSFTLTQCRMVGDRLTGVQVSELHSSNRCFRRCRDRYKDDKKDEERRHRHRLHDCRGNANCIQQENQRHAARMAAIEAAYAECLNRCHSQGGGRDDD
jgi:hypothetical protein